MLRPLPPASPSTPMPKASTLVRQNWTSHQPALRFGNAKAPISANPFVWLFNGIKRVCDWFSKTKVGQWVNRLFSKINQFLKAKPNENPKPASPAPAATKPPAAVAVNPKENPKKQENPQPPTTEPVASKPPFVPYSERSLEALQKKQAKFQKLKTAFSHEQAEIQKKLDDLERQRAEQQKRLKQAQCLWSEEEEEFLIPDLRKGISILDAEIKRLRHEHNTLQSKQDFIQKRKPQLEYWIQFRQNLQAAQ